MKMLMIGLLSLLSVTSYASGERGNGGGAIVCKDTNGKVKKITLFDLYNFGVYDHLSFKQSFNSENQVIDFAIARISETGNDDYLNKLKNALKEVEDAWTTLPSGTEPIAAEDAKLAFVPTDGCRPVYLVNYQTINGVDHALVHSDLTSDVSFSPLEAGALKLHEAVYKLRRFYDGDADSLVTQEIVALLLADKLSDHYTIRLSGLLESKPKPEVIGYAFGGGLLGYNPQGPNILSSNCSRGDIKLMLTVLSGSLKSAYYGDVAAGDSLTITGDRLPLGAESGDKLNGGLFWSANSSALPLTKVRVSLEGCNVSGSWVIGSYDNNAISFEFDLIKRITSQEHSFIDFSVGSNVVKCESVSSGICI